MKRYIHALVLAAFVAQNSLLVSCSGDDEPRKETRKTQTVATTATVSEGLDLSRLPELVKEAENGEDLEEILNSSGINNLDTNGDKKVDYLNVEEFREGRQRGFMLFTNENGKRQDVANVTITPVANTADVVVDGNPKYYGDNHRYHSTFPLASVLMVAWLYNSTRPRYYHRPYYYGYYPSYYRTSYVKPRSIYRSRVKNSGFTVKRVTRSKTKPVTSKTTKTVKTQPTAKSLKNVKGKSFSTTTKKRPSSTKTTTSSGFGSSSTRTKPKTTSSFGGSSTRTQPKTSSFGSSSTRTKPKTSSFGSSSTRKRSSFGSSSKRKRRKR